MKDPYMDNDTQKTDQTPNNDQEGEKALAPSQSLINKMEKARLAEYAMYTEHPFRLLGMNFLIGLARGLGGTVGLAVVLMILIFLLQNLVSANLPYISQWMGHFLTDVQGYMK
jgi:hypothetical protein